MTDQLIGFLTENGDFRVVTAVTVGLANDIRKRHGCSFRVTDAMSRFVTGTVLLASNLKGTDAIAAYLNCSGPIQGLRAEANALGHVKGFPLVPGAGVDELDADYVMDLTQLLGYGQLTVTRTVTGGRAPVSGTVAVSEGELAIAFSRYLLQSEQVHSATLLGNYLAPDGTVTLSGGLLVQAMPGVTEDALKRMEDALAALPPVHEVLQEADDPGQMALLMLPQWGLRRVLTRPISFRCSCSFEKAIRVLQAMDPESRDSVRGPDGQFHVRCEYCGQAWSVADVGKGEQA